MNIRDAIGRINFMANRDAEVRDTRRAVVGAVAEARKSPGGLAGMIRGMGRIGSTIDAELDTWIDPADVAAGQGGRFDVCDLRAWLKIADRADVAAVPAKTIMSMSEAELESVLEKISIPGNMESNLAKHIDRALDADPQLRAEMDAARDAAEVDDAPARRAPADLMEGAFQAMEEIPASWMVRTHLCGSSNLKSLVGTGVMLKGDDTANLAPGVDVGAGWAQIGNRRVIDFRDRRFVELAIRGHKPETHYLARPWAQPARFHEGEDLHRANSPLAGPGKWPAEWRVFVKNGEITGVANYYGWTGEGRTGENAWNAIEAAGKARRMVETAVAQGLVSGYMDTTLARNAAKSRADFARALEDLDPDGLHATLDFIEAEDGLVFLEAGPGHIPGGGGHPTAFAGQDMDRSDPKRTVAACRGVAYRAMPHVHLGEPETWMDGDPAGSIDTWEAAAALASSWRELSGDARDLLREKQIDLTDTMEP